MNSAELQFNIIFSPHTVEYLSPLLHRLLEHSDCRYRITSVACSEEDVATLKAMCDAHERLEFMAAFDELIEHGKMLSWLQERTDSPYFCFMDSDILAVAPFMDAVATQMENCDVFSTGHPLWYADDDIVFKPDYQRLHGIYFKTKDGLDLGGTYFAIYDNALLSRTMQQTGIDFRYYMWDEVPPEHQRTVTEMGMRKLEYDTGKLLMLLMTRAGARFHSEDLPEVRHLGGFSARAGEGPANYFRGPTDKVASKLFGGAFAAPVMRTVDCWYAWRCDFPDMPKEYAAQSPFRERRVMQTRVHKRINTARYFNVYVRSLLGKNPEPPAPVLGDRVAEQRIAAAAEELRRLFAEHPPA